MGRYCRGQTATVIQNKFVVPSGFDVHRPFDVKVVVHCFIAQILSELKDSQYLWSIFFSSAFSDEAQATIQRHGFVDESQWMDAVSTIYRCSTKAYGTSTGGSEMDTAVTMESMGSDSSEITISCYINEIPAFIEMELARLYCALHSSLPYFKIFRSTQAVSCYVAWREGQPIAVLLFEFNDGCINVLNEMIELDQEELRRFCRYIFARFSVANIISFKALKTNAQRFGFPVQRSNAKDTFMIALPNTAQEYTGAIGKSTRATLRHQLNKVVRDYPSFSSRFYSDEEIDEQQVREIIRFNEAKISSKAYKFSHDERRIFTLAKICGFVNVILIDGRICAGTVNYRVGSSYYGEVIGYDFAYERSGIGKLAVYLTICECIKRGGKKFYLGGGRFEFKTKMLGVQQDMDRLEIYRSYGQFILNIDKAARAAIHGYVRQLKIWLRKHEDKQFAQLIFNTFYFWQNLKNR